MTLFYRFAHVVCSIVTAILFRYKVVGKENIPLSGPVILCSNHLSNWDPVFIGLSTKRHVSFLAKDSLFHAPVIGSIARAAGAIPVKRGKNDIGMIRVTLTKLKNNSVISIFPEGTRVAEEGEHEAKSGVGLFALKSKAAIVPILIRTHQSRVRLFRKVEVRVGEAFFAENLNFESQEDARNNQYQYISDYAMSKVRLLADCTD
jgi:1-acyl-sn-glycerol-3-phosphate acyltransferase